MGNIITRPIASAAERIAASTYLWSHTGSSPAVDRRIAATDIPMKGGNGAYLFGSSLDEWYVGSDALRIRTGAVWAFGGANNNQIEIEANSCQTSLGTYKFTNSGYATQIRLIEGEFFFNRSSVSSTAGNTITYQTKLKIALNGDLAAGADAAQDLGTAAIRWNNVRAAVGTIQTSDERLKTEIGEIPDAWLDAWADVQWQRFKFIDGNRWHIGLVAQAVHAAFAGHGLDAFDIGLCCYDAWNEQREPIFENVTKTRLITAVEQEKVGEDEDGNPLFRMREIEVEEEYEETVDTGETRVTLEAGDRWGLRYDECQAMEAAWQRREISRLADRLAALESTAQ